MTQEVITPECAFLCRQGGGGTHFGACSSRRVVFEHKGWRLKKKKRFFRGSSIVLIDPTEKCNERCRWNECKNFIFAEVIDQNNLWTIIYLLKVCFF